MFRLKTPLIEFLTDEENRGVIPEPYPAVKHQQDWYKNLPQNTASGGLHSGTVKRCAPFLESMSVGYIIPLAADVDISIEATDLEDSTVNTSTDFYQSIIGHHSSDQLGKDHPSQPSPIMKFSNYWAIKVPRGWSVLFVPPLNRPDPRFECFSGVVECDRYWNYVNFPFFMKDRLFKGTIKQGTPLVQAIPFKRGKTTHRVASLSKKDSARLEKTKRCLSACISHYRDKIWRKSL